MKLNIQQLTSQDINTLVSSFAEIGWNKPRSTFEQYFKEQENNERLIWLAFIQDQFAGYITLKWESYYLSFKENNIPEIMDLNVLPKLQHQGIGTALLHIAEQKAYEQSNIVGIGVGLSADYGSAQNGLGITYQYKHVVYGETVTLDDDLVLWFTKQNNGFRRAHRIHQNKPTNPRSIAC